MNSSQIMAAVLTCMTAVAMPPGYTGKPFRDQFHKSGPQSIPGTVQLALYDLGGEGVAYHDKESSPCAAARNRSYASGLFPAPRSVAARLSRSA
jgi:hypothetical protein